MGIWKRLSWAGVTAVFLAVTVTGCTIKATTKSVTDVVTNFTSSTSAKSWITADGTIRDEHKVTVYVRENFDNLAHDMARGRGEYLASLGRLLSVKEGQAAEFYAFAQTAFPSLINVGEPTPENMLVSLHQALADNPTLSHTTL